LTSVIAAYYYLNVIAQMYFKEPGERETANLCICTKILVTICSAVMLLGTACAPWIMDWVEKIVW
jgi:NADH-quinone oxidoreductase subunit N